MPPVTSRPAAANGEAALQIENNLARKALACGDRDTAWHHLYHLTARLNKTAAGKERDALFISTALELANISFVLGKGFSDLSAILENALAAAGRMGDRRSSAILKLHLGRLFYFAEQRDKAMTLFSSGKTEVEELGDEDIKTQAAEFIGLYFFIQGRFRDAIAYFEGAAHSFESDVHGRIINTSGPLWLCYSAAFLGQFHHAIGTLDYYRRLALEGSDRGLATTLRAALGIILLGIKRNKEAHFHLSGAYQEAVSTQNALAEYFAKGGLAIHHFTEGRLKEARNWIQQITSNGAATGLINQYASPIVLETLFDLHRKGFLHLTHMKFPTEFKRIMREQNVHLRGVALRLKAMDAMENNRITADVESDLKRSEQLLIQSGDPVQLGKTRLEVARLNLRRGNAAAARVAAEAARKDFGSYVDVFFPDDLRPLITVKSDLNRYQQGDSPLLEMFADVIQELSPSADFDHLLARTVKATNRFFGAERGGIFWFRRHGASRGPALRGPCNLSPADVAAAEFKQSLALIFRTFHENSPQVVRQDEFDLNPSRIKAMLCVPFEVEGHVHGVLYHDNSYVRDCFESFSTAQLPQMARWLTSYIDHIFQFSRRLEQKAADQIGQLESPDSSAIITKSPVMKKMLGQVDRIAASDSTVLILGETGVGKELLARQIHQVSPRKNNPLVIIDPTAIPDSLVESELFGHEKGAFTGADRQKKGRLELAHTGTLFIDEVGEIHPSIQVKLLRAIQEKTMVRIGGSKSIYSDFRLVAATNRDLAEEVAAGRFREDLYYRLNVIPVTLPPLRERPEDIMLLVEHFLTRFAGKYSREPLSLTSEDQGLLCAYAWPGNIRELQNVMERAVLLASGGRLHLDLPSARGTSPRAFFSGLPTLDDLQRHYIQFILEKTGGKMSGADGAAEILGMKRTSLYNRMKKLGVR